MSSSSLIDRNPNLPLQPTPLTEWLRQSQQKLQQGRSAGNNKNHHHRKKALLYFCAFQSLPYPRGLFNAKNFCFINAVLQAWIFAPPLAHLAVSSLLLEESTAKRCCPTLLVLGKWCLEYWKPGRTRASLLPPVLPFHTSAGFAGNVQNDAHEYLQRLLECLDTELMEVEKTLAETHLETRTTRMESDLKGWTVVGGHGGREKLTYQVHRSEHSAILSSILGGITESHVSGNASGKAAKTSVTVETFYMLSLKIGMTPSCTIEEALQHTFKPEKIEMNSSDAAASAGQQRSAHTTRYITKTTLVLELPEILILHLSRCAVTREGDTVKLDNHVAYENQLLFPGRLCADRLTHPNQRTYRLLSAVTHRGNAVEGGHYVTYLAPGAAGNPSAPAVSSTAHQDPSSFATPAGGRGVQTPGRGRTRPPPQPATGVSSPIPVGQFVLCDDVKVTVESNARAKQETVYFLVYQKI